MKNFCHLNYNGKAYEINSKPAPGIDAKENGGCAYGTRNITA